MIRKTATYLLVISSIIFCSSANAAVPSRYGGTLSLYTQTDPRTFNPVTTQETSSTAVLSLIFEGLTRIDGHTGEVLPQLAQSWQVDETGTEWTVNLRSDVLWSDGEPFTADDVVFTFGEIIANPAIAANSKNVFIIDGQPVTVEKINDFQVRFNTPGKFAPFLQALSQPIVPKHCLAEAVANGTFNEAWHVGVRENSIVGTGPFCLNRYVPGSFIELTRNRQYWKHTDTGTRLPYLDRIVFRIISNPDLALVAFKNKELDIYPVRGSDYAWLEPLAATHHFTITKSLPSLMSFFLSFNQCTRIDPLFRRPYIPAEKLQWFRNVNFRKAVAYAIDRDAIGNLVFYGFADPEYSPMNKATGYFYDGDVTRYSYDVSRARALLKQEGIYDRDGDGVCEDTAGNPIVFSIVTNADNPAREQVAHLIAENLRAIGFDVRVTLVEFNALVAKLTTRYDWESVLMGFTGVVDPHFASNVWRSDGPLHLWYPREKKPATEWEQEIDNIFDAGVKELDREKRKALYDRWQEIAADKVPFIYITVPQIMYAIQGRVHDCEPTPLGGVTDSIDEVYVE